MKHNGYEFGVQQVPIAGEAWRFRWIIYPKVEEGPKVVGLDTYATSDEAREC